MKTETADLLETIRGALAPIRKDLTTIHSGMQGGDGSLPIGIALKHLGQAIEALSYCLKPVIPKYTETEGADFLNGLNSGSDS